MIWSEKEFISHKIYIYTYTYIYIYIYIYIYMFKGNIIKTYISKYVRVNNVKITFY